MALDFISAIDDVEPAVADRKADGLGAPGTDGRIIDKPKRAVVMDAEHRDGVASLVDCEEQTSVRTGDDFLVGIIGSEQPLRIGDARTTGVERSDLRDLTVGVLPVCNHGVLAGIGIVGFRVNKTCGMLANGAADMSWRDSNVSSPQNTNERLACDDDESWEHLVLAVESKSPPRYENNSQRIRLGLAARLCLLVVCRIEILTARSDEVAINVARRTITRRVLGALTFVNAPTVRYDLATIFPFTRCKGIGGELEVEHDGPESGSLRIIDNVDSPSGRPLAREDGMPCT